MNRRHFMHAIGAVAIAATVVRQSVARTLPCGPTLGEHRLTFFRYLLQPVPGRALVLVHLSGGDTDPGFIWTDRETYEHLSKQGGPYKLRLVLDAPVAAAALREAPEWVIDDPYARIARRTHCGA